PDDSTNPYFIQLIATGTFPNVKQVASNLLFGKVTINTLKPLPCYIVNSGTDTLHIDSIVAGGQDPTAFTISPAGPKYAVKPGDTLKLVATFKPTVDKYGYKGTFSVWTDVK